MADSFILLIILAAVAAFLLYPIWKKKYGSSCTTTTPGTTPAPSGPVGPCFTPSTIPVKPGIIDLSNCTDDVYIIRNNPTQVKIITGTTVCA